MKTLVIGSTGLVGSRFVELSKDLALLTPSHQELDLSDQSSLEKYLLANQPDSIINFAAYTNVSQAESETDQKDGPCWQLNVSAVNNLLSITKGVPFIHISTDMVFSGDVSDPGPYSEDHPPQTDPKKLTWYGYSKLEGERAVVSANQTVVRIIYPIRASFQKKLDYLRFPLSLYSQGKLYPLFNDQQVSTTFIDELVLVLHSLIQKPTPGIFHVSSDTFTPYDLVTYALSKLGADVSSVKTTSVVEYLKTQTNPYRYPVKGGLLATKTQTSLGLKFRSWKQIVDELITQGLALA